MKHLERAWRCRATGYIAHNDFTAFQGLLTEVDRLARALGVGRHGKINTGLAATLPAPSPPVHHHATGPARRGSGRLRRRQKRVTYSGPREAPPLQYPWAPEPPVSPPRRSDPVTVPRYTGPYWVDPYVARLRAEANAQWETLRRNGEVQYHGADDPPTCAMRDTA